MELLSPGGSLEKLKYAIIYGADAVYASGKKFGLRSKSTNLTYQELKEAVTFCHHHQKKIYITVNIFPHNKHINEFRTFLQFLQDIQADGLIISDPGVFTLAREITPKLPIHISTQANVTSWKSAEFWYKLGARRIILARELSYEEIKTIRNKIPELELEIFIHGAMCMAYSGRCLLSMFLNKRNANLGNCSQPCRWKYSLLEETRPGEFFTLEEDENGSYILNSKDLCLINKLQKIIELGINSVKIEGRMKSIYYSANLTRTYRTAISYLKNKESVPDSILKEVHRVSHRHYTEGFFSEGEKEIQHYSSSSYIRNYQFIGLVKANKDNWIDLEVKSGFSRDDQLELIYPDFHNDYNFRVSEIRDEENQPINKAKPNSVVKLLLQKKTHSYGIVRKKIQGNDHETL